MWEMIFDVGFCLALVCGFAIYHRNEVYGGTDDSQT